MLLDIRLLQFLLFLGFCQAYATRCHRFCNCEETNTINCTNVGDEGLQILKALTSYDYINLNYLFINGGRFGDLPNSNIFGLHVLRSLHTIRFVNTGITSFGPETFSGVPNLNYLSLDGNPLRSVQSHSMKYMSDLKSLSLNRIFDADRQNNAAVLKSIFDSPLPRLQNVSLHGNEIRFDITETICKLPRLLHADLSNNRLESFSLPPICIAPIEELYLHDNDLTELPGLSNVPLKSLTLHGNPLNCDWDVCDQEKTLSLLVNTTSAYCAFPAKQRQRSVAELMAEQTCSSSSVIRNILIGLGIMLMAVVLSIWWNGCCSRVNYYNKESYDMVRLSEETTDPTFV
ncbi:Leucine-rich repeat-containing protein 15 [Aphelenchoides bicaudatus]|nr:Leucine-rich repeat-containing protein 15 [Aphelenchoides bicaudatus]